MQPRNVLLGSGHPRPGVTGIDEKSDSIKDRDLQDQIIRYLTDADIRSNDVAFLNWEEAERARRFSRFLARRYYRDRLQRGFRHSARLLDEGSRAESVVNSRDFDAIADRSVLGSLSTSLAVVQFAIAHLLPLRNEEWWSEILAYERALFIQMATSDRTEPSRVPKKNAVAILGKFHFPMPELLSQLKRGADPCGPRREMTLLFSRTREGKIYVAEVDESAEIVFEAVNDVLSEDELANSCRLAHAQTCRILQALADIGSVVLPAR